MSSLDVDVIGGAYLEECAFPTRSICQGSGARAAAILASLGAQVSLHSFTGPSKCHFEEIARNLKFKLIARDKQTDISFHYSHPLARPQIFPTSVSIEEQSNETVKAKNVLVFGMIEGRIPVHADRAVYDPQDGINSKHYTDNGSSANELALVVSYSEGAALTGKLIPTEIAACLLMQPNVVTAIVKCGPQGALVATPNEMKWIGAFPSGRVYKIGSGDVFSAAFAFAWLTKGSSALLSAWFASRIVAAYVECGMDSIDALAVQGYWDDANKGLIERTNSVARIIPTSQIYLAGPFFTTAQRWAVDEARAALRDMGFRVFSPVHDVGLGSSDEVVQEDLFELGRSQVVLALLDGMDTGTIFEIGYARANGIPVIAVAESARDSDLTMLFGSGCSVVDDYSTGIYYACWQLMGDV